MLVECILQTCPCFLWTPQDHKCLCKQHGTAWTSVELPRSLKRIEGISSAAEAKEALPKELECLEVGCDLRALCKQFNGVLVAAGLVLEAPFTVQLVSSVLFHSYSSG